jgi:large subunit ribosomal protein L10
MARSATDARAQKSAVVTEVRERLTGSTATLLTEYRGLTVTELAKLRAELRRNDAEYKVVKNTLARRAVADAGLELPDEALTGPTAITFCAGDPIAVAKVLRAFSKDHPHLVIKGGILEGRALGAEEAGKLADLASREELLATLAGLFMTIVAQPARLAQANLTKAVRLFAALQDKRAAAGEQAEAPAADAPEADAPEADAPEADAPEADAPEADAPEADAPAGE